MKFKTISAKFSFALGLILVCFGVLAVYIAYNLSTTRFEEREFKSITDDIYQHGKLLENVFDSSTLLVEAISENGDFKEFLSDPESVEDVDTINQKLSAYNLGGRYSAIYLIGKNGVTLASTNESFLGKDYSFRPYFQKSILGGHYADVNLGVTSKELGYYFAHPVSVGDEIVGVATIKMSPSGVSQFLEDNQLKSLSDLMLVDHYGVVVESSKPNRIFNSLGELSPGLRENLEKENKYSGEKTGALQYQVAMDGLANIDGIEKFRMYDEEDKSNETLIVGRVGHYDFFLVAEISENIIKGEGHKLGYATGAIVGGVVIAVVVFILYFTKKLLRPISQLSSMSRQITVGNLEVTNPLSGDDELAILGQTMETMAKTIKRRYGELEERVAERTKQLTQQSETLEQAKTALTNVLEDVEASAAELEKFKLAVDNASDQIVITDSEGIVLYANKGMEQISGFKVEDVIGKKAGTKPLYGGKMTEEFYKKMWNEIKEKKKHFECEINNKRKNGEDYIAQTEISPILNDKGEVEFFVAIQRDITHEKEIDRMKTDFISLASHQLRTPLSAIRWFTEMLLAGDAGKINKDQEEYLNNIYQSNDRMINLVNSLLNISRIESGRIIVDPEPTDLKTLLQEVLLEIDNRIKEKKQTILLSVHDDLPKINIDPKLIREVYKNLLTNANKYTQEGGEISIFVSKNGKEIVSQISDNGLGIPKAAQARVFERFYRAENIIKLETEGTGLGLYLAKAIVESSKGKIWFESEENKGTSFWFTLPLSGVKAKKGEVRINS